jgi:hypothetical protein
MQRHNSTARNRELEDNAKLLRTWKAWHREERARVLAGPHAATLTELFRMLDNIKHVHPSQLVGLVQSITWSSIDYPTRLVVVHEVNSAIIKRRESQGLIPFDDGFPGDPPNAFQLIRAAILSFHPTVAPPGAQPGLISHPETHAHRNQHHE